MRGRLLRFAEGFAVINDCYNSNPVALSAMAELLARTPGYGPRILVAGEMLELGPESRRLHRQSGEQAVALNIDRLIGVQNKVTPRRLLPAPLPLVYRKIAPTFLLAPLRRPNLSPKESSPAIWC